MSYKRCTQFKDRKTRVFEQNYFGIRTQCTYIVFMLCFDFYLDLKLEFPK